MAVKCTECGASLQDDSRFCRYCGAKVGLEDLKRVEVKIDNTAEIKRAGYEEKESELRQKMMKRELRTRGLKWKICGILFLISLTMMLPGILHSDQPIPGVSLAGLVLGALVIIFAVVEWMNKR